MDTGKNNIYMFEEYVILKPKNLVKIHNHKMPHILSSADSFKLCIDGQIKEGKTAIISSDVAHSIVSMHSNSNMLLIMPLTDLYFQINKLADNKYIISENYSTIEEIIYELNKSGISYRSIIEDNRVIEIIENINKGAYERKTVADIAGSVNLSESRLEHLFSDKTGIRLKHYLLLYKLRKAYKHVWEGKSVTDAAYEGGFSDSSHLAAVSKRLLGISITDVIKNNN